MYGVIGNNYFNMYELASASGITSLGRMMIKSSAKIVSNFIADAVQNKENHDYLIGGDTDSCVASTLLCTSKGNMTIENLFNISENYIKKDENNKRYVKKVENMEVLTVNKSKELVYSPIKYVMKHKVKKRMYKLTIDGNSVRVTEDHSLMCVRDNELIEVKPKELQKGDKILYLKS